MATLGLELDELLGDVVACPLRQNAQHGPAGLVEPDALGQRAPAGAAAALRHVSELQHRHADQPVLAREAVVLDAQMQLVAVGLRLVAQNTTNSNQSAIVALFPDGKTETRLANTQIPLYAFLSRRYTLWAVMLGS